MVMVSLEGGQGDVRGACAPPPKKCPTWIPPPHPNSPHLDTPPQRTLLDPLPKPVLDPPPICPSLTPPPGASGQQLVTGG